MKTRQGASLRYPGTGTDPGRKEPTKRTQPNGPKLLGPEPIKTTVLRMSTHSVLYCIHQVNNEEETHLKHTTTYIMSIKKVNYNKWTNS